MLANIMYILSGVGLAWCLTSLYFVFKRNPEKKITILGDSHNDSKY